MTKLFASDFDGTLHVNTFSSDGASTDSPDPAQHVTPSDLAAIRAFQQEGGLFGVCTGRPFFGLVDQVGHEIPFDFYIASTGASIHDRTWNVLWRTEVSREAVRELYHALLPFAKKSGAYIEAGDRYWILGDSPSPNLIHSAHSIDELEGPFVGMGIETVTVEAAQEAAAYVRTHFADTFDAFVNLASIDVVPAGCSKGTGLVRAAELFGADLTAGIGDSFNDLPLIETAHVGYTFHRADSALHPAADVLVDSVAEALADFGQR